jgi:serine/threonine protein kinase
LNDLSGYAKEEKLGNGSYGCVYRAKTRSTGKTIAWKQLKDLRTRADRELADREIEILSGFRYPTLLSLHGYFMRE